MASCRIGHGYDVHALASGESIRLGGVSIPCEFSLVAHSDGDVVIHALCDAILGALGKGDIGELFPDSSADNKDRDSREFLRECQQLAKQDGFALGNADITIIAQQPRLSAHKGQMKTVIAEDLQVDQRVINVKATTTERLGYIGRSEGIAVHAVVILEATG